MLQEEKIYHTDAASMRDEAIPENTNASQWVSFLLKLMGAGIFEALYSLFLHFLPKTVCSDEWLLNFPLIRIASRCQMFIRRIKVRIRSW